MARVSLNSRGLKTFTLDDFDGNPVDVLADMDNVDIVISYGTPQERRTRHGDNAQRYDKIAPKDGSIRVSGQANLDDGSAQTLFSITAMDDSGVRTFNIEWAAKGNVGYGISGECVIQGEPAPTFTVNPETGRATVGEIVFLPAGAEWTVSNAV